MTSNISQIPCGTQTDDYYRLNVHQLSRAGALKPGYRVRWKVGESSIDILVAESGLIAAGHAIQIVRTRVHFGGSRPWFICPKCKERRAVLYIGPYCCLQCAQIKYTSITGSGPDRAKRQAQKLRARLQWSSDPLDVDGSKPKWMRWPTFQRLCAQHAELKRRWIEGYL